MNTSYTRSNMVVLLNPHAGGGTATRKWEQILPDLESQRLRIHILDGESRTRDFLAHAIVHGESDFVAAGGDGTVNLLTNTVLSLTSAAERSRIRIGAIGLGSSNDFHKPFMTNGGESVVHSRIDFANAAFRDVGCVAYRSGREIATRYFLINASVGLAAEANAFFNTPDGILGLLKGMSTPAAIQYAALRTIAKYRNIEVEVADDLHSSRTVKLTHLSILKNLNFSGSLHWRGESVYDDGKFQVRMCRDMNRMQCVRMLTACAKGQADELPGVDAWQCNFLTISARTPFAVECDGEVIETTFAQFSILPRYLKVCRS
jgi:diacylglycerol kinase (ATP)